MNVLIFDCETTGLDPEKDRIIEVGAVLWSVEHRTILEAYSCLLHTQENGAERWNGISPAVLQSVERDDDVAWGIVDEMSCWADFACAHQARFDRSFVANERESNLYQMTWVCTKEDMIWPKLETGGSLVNLALAHKVPVISAHRALDDCMLLARLFETLPDVKERLLAAMEEALKPKFEFRAMTKFEENDLVKQAGFHWNGTHWTRRMSEEKAQKLPFKVAPV